MIEETFYSNQISVYKTKTKLVEFLGNLNLAPINNYAKLHANGDLNNNLKTYSKIKVVLQDYSKETTTRAVANIDIEIVDWVLSNLENNVKDFSLDEMKIFGEPDVNGNSKVTKLKIHRSDTFIDKKTGKSELQKLPWTIYIENGYGKKSVTTTGGTVANSIKIDNKIHIKLLDYDLFKLLKRVSKYISIWELTNCPKLVRDGATQRDKQLEDYFAKNNVVKANFK